MTGPHPADDPEVLDVDDHNRRAVEPGHIGDETANDEDDD